MAAAERLSLIVNRDYDKVGSWTRACALVAAGDLAGAVVPDLLASLHHPDPLMSELAAFTLMKLDPAACARHHEKLDYDARERLAYAVGPDGTRAHWDSRSVYGRAALLRAMPAFGSLPSGALVHLARASEELVLNPRRRVPSPRAPRESFYVNVDGVQSLEGAKPRRAVPPRSLIAFGPGAFPVEVIERTRFVRIDPDALFDVATEHVGLVPVLLEARQQGPARAGEPLDEEAPARAAGLALAGA